MPVCRTARCPRRLCAGAAGLWLCLAVSAPAGAQPSLLPQPAASTDAGAPVPEADVETPADVVAPDSPREALRGFFEATRSGRWDEAAAYLVLTGEQQGRGPELAERLKGVIDAGDWIDLETISGLTTGALDDGLPPELEAVGTVSLDGRDEPLRMVRRSGGGEPAWAFSSSTVARIDSWYAELPDRWVRDTLVDAGADVLLRPGPFELLWWQWIAVLLLVALAWGAGRVLSWLATLVVHRLTARRPDRLGTRLAHAIGPPATLLGALLVFVVGMSQLVLTGPALAFVARGVAVGVLVAVFWALWRSVDVVTSSVLSMAHAGQSASARSLMSVGANLLRAAIAIGGVLAVVGALGYPVATVLAGLGIGGLAIAFGAQKTIENLFGSIALAVDQPFRVGDFVKVEDFVGTVEGIGLRSTRFRTLDRTVVSIPNGKLADERLESFQVRDRMRLATTIGVTYDTTAEQMREILQGFERVLREHPKIWPDAMVVKFKEFGASSLDIEIMAWFAVPTWGDFQACREEVLLGFMGVVEAAGSSFAFPTRTVHLVQEGTND